MRKFLLLSAIAAVVQISSAQAPTARPQKLGNSWIQQSMQEDRPVVVIPQGNTSAASTSHVINTHRTNTARHGNTLKSLGNGATLNEQAIGSAGNLLTITNFNCNQLYGYNSGQIDLVSFIHRTDNTVSPTGNIAQYSYDFSKDGGNTWSNNVGPFTVGTIPNGDIIDNAGTDPHGRFPQGAIFNRSGNNNPDSAYLVYSGTWHNSPPTGTATGSWMGQMRGRGQFTGDSSTFNVHVDTVNNGAVNIASGFCAGAPGVFWAVNQDWSGTFSTTSNDITRGVIVEKGVWNANTRDIDWTYNEIYQQFDSFTANSVIITAAQSFDIAFDPTGQNGWISCLGDISLNPVDSTNNPIFWHTTDGGAHWSNAMQIPLDSLPGVVAALNLVTLYQGPPPGNNPTGLVTSGIPTTSFQAKLTVDYLGNPHLFTTVGNGNSYSIESGAGYTAYDITLNPTNSCTPTWNGWAAVFVDSIQTLRGNTTTDATPLTEDNRPLVSRSADGTKLFFFWSATDVNTAQGDNNEFPNLWVRGFDIVHSTSTPSINLTEGDSRFGGPTTNFPNGGNIEGASLQGAFYPTVSPIALPYQSTGWNIPVVLTQIDYTANAGSSSDPAQFWYVSNINFSPFDFTNGITATVSLNGADTVYLPVNTSYSDAGATLNYLDTACTHSGILHIVTNSSGLVDSVPGTYYVSYSAEDSAGNIYATTNRVVVVTSPPVANFSYFVSSGFGVQFTDLSLYNPTSWSWTFGDGGSDVVQNPYHGYTAAGSFNVCLTASNTYGSSAQHCQLVAVTGINDIEFASRINMFPNPANGRVTLSLEGNATPDFKLSVYNVLGEEVMPVSEYKAGTTNVDMNVSALSSGVYLVKVQSNQGSAVKRLTVSHK